MTGALELQPSTSDGDLARAAAEGDRQAFAEIYDRYADRLYDFCVGLIGDRDAAADCVQDAFCVVATDLSGLREPDKLRPWLYSIARHHAMRRLRHRYREEVSDELPDMISHEASPETLAGQSELARLVAEAAGGLSDRDRELLDLSYRHGLDGPELAEALGVTLTSANTMMFRLRQTVERCLGALLVARGAQANPDACPELAAILKGWDGQFSVLMRKRMARHIDSCAICEQDQRQHVNPVALLGGSAVFIPAPVWLRRQTLDRVQLTCASSALTETSGSSADYDATGASGLPAGSGETVKRRLALAVGIPLVCLGLAITWFARSEDPVSRVVDTGSVSDDQPLPVAPAGVRLPPAPGQPQQVTPAGTGQQSLPNPQAQTPAAAGAPIQTPGAENPGAATVLMLPNGEILAPGPAQIGPVMVPGSDPKAVGPSPQVDIAPVDTAPVDTAPVDTAPVVTKIVEAPATPGGPINLGPLPGPGPKIASPTPGTLTATVSDPTAKAPTNPSKPSTTGGGTTGGGTTGGGTTSGGTTSGGTTSGGGKTTGSGSGSNTKNSTSTSK